MVEQEDHHAVAQLRHAVGHAEGEQSAVNPPVHPEAHDVERAPSAQEVAQIDDAGEQLAQPRGDGGAPDAPVQHEDGQIVKRAVCQTAGHDRRNGDAGITVRLDENLHVIGDDEAQRERREPAQIVNRIIERRLVRAEQARKRHGEHQHQQRDCDADHRQQGEVLGKETVGPFALAAAEVDGDDGVCTDGEDDRNGEQDICEGDGQIDGGHGKFSDALGNEQSVDDGVE